MHFPFHAYFNSLSLLALLLNLIYPILIYPIQFTLQVFCQKTTFNHESSLTDFK